jgi:hypothetical protein
MKPLPLLLTLLVLAGCRTLAPRQSDKPSELPVIPDVNNLNKLEVWQPAK